MGCERVVLEFPRGSDVNIELPWVDDDDQPLPMDGFDLEIFEAGPRGAVASYILANATFDWTDQSQGLARFTLPWSSEVPREFWVRLRIVPNPDAIGKDGIDPLFVRYT